MSQEALSQNELEQLLSDEPVDLNEKPADTMPVQAAGAIPAIMRILDGIDPKFHPVIFQALAGIQRVASGESVTEIGLQLDEIEKNRVRRNNGKRKWFKG